MINVSLAKHYEILTKVIEDISHLKDEETKVNSILQSLRELGISNEVSIQVGVLDERKNVLVIKYSDKESSDLVVGLHIPIRKSPEKGLGSYLVKPSSNPLKSTPSSSVTSILMFPLIREDKVIGIFSLSSKSKKSFSKAFVAKLKPFSYLLADSIIPITSKSKGNDVVTSVRRFRKKQILILGKDTGSEASYLVTISKFLKKNGYSPVRVKDYPDIPELSNEEKVRVFADNCRFVILENSFAAGQIAEIKMLSTNRIITATLRQRGTGSSFMVTDYFKDYEFIKEFEYENSTESMEQSLKKAIEWAELKTQERIEYYNNVYPWRKTDKKNHKKAEVPPAG
jgi:hypothetical protein